MSAPDPRRAHGRGGSVEPATAIASAPWPGASCAPAPTSTSCSSSFPRRAGEQPPRRRDVSVGTVADAGVRARPVDADRQRGGGGRRRGHRRPHRASSTCGCRWPATPSSWRSSWPGCDSSGSSAAKRLHFLACVAPKERFERPGPVAEMLEPNLKERRRRPARHPGARLGRRAHPRSRRRPGRRGRRRRHARRGRGRTCAADGPERLVCARRRPPRRPRRLHRTASPAGVPTSSRCRSRTPSPTLLGIGDADALVREIADVAPARLCGSRPTAVGLPGLDREGPGWARQRCARRRGVGA